MKKTVLAFLLIALLLVSSVMLASCSKKNKTTSDLPESENSPSEEAPIIAGDIFKVLASDGIVVIESGNNFTIEVGYETTILQLHKYVEVADGIEWMIATDVSMQEEIVNKTVALNEGENIFFVYCYNADESIMENYVITIRRQGSYTVSFEGISETQSVVEGQFASIPVGKPTKEGYDFAEWDFDFTKPVNGDVTIYAKWSPKSFKITYDANLGVLSGAKEVTVVYGEEVTLATPSRDGFVFADWYYGDTCVKSGVWTIPSDVKLTARWANDSYTVTFDPAGGTMEGATVVEISYGAPITFPVPVKDGFTFGGWYDGDTLCLDGSYEYTKDLNLVARWNERSATLTFFENGGSKNSYTETMSFGAALPVPEREGFTFGGWFSDIELTKKVSTVPEESMRLYAWWSEEGKPGEFVYESSGMSYKVTARVDRESTVLVPTYIGGRKTLDAIPRPNAEAGVYLEKDNLSVKIDRTQQIIATFIPKFEGDDTTLVYESNKKQIATVDENGVITAHKTGSCVITVRNEATGFEAFCVVIVESTEKNPSAGITIDPSTATMIPGEELVLNVTLVSEYADDDKTLTFLSTEPSVVFVDEKGNLQALTLGSSNILISDAYGLQNVCTVTVVEKKPNENPGITLDKESVTLTEEEQVTVNATFVPTYQGDDTTLLWETDNDQVATVEGGVIT
ncbi:MAG: InlB B-repeat-containing protein, partial [Clostridia bacterium]|nr:InlB B-repeat-containing protein [Clostridia bacterium]